MCAWPLLLQSFSHPLHLHSPLILSPDWTWLESPGLALPIQARRGQRTRPSSGESTLSAGRLAVHLFEFPRDGQGNLKGPLSVLPTQLRLLDSVTYSWASGFVCYWGSRFIAFCPVKSTKPDILQPDSQAVLQGEPLLWGIRNFSPKYRCLGTPVVWMTTCPYLGMPNLIFRKTYFFVVALELKKLYLLICMCVFVCVSVSVRMFHGSCVEVRGQLQLAGESCNFIY